MRMKSNSRYPFFASVLVGAMLAVTAFAQDTKEGTVDHSVWNEIVDATVSDDGWVDYQAIKRKWSRKLRAYISSLGSVDVGKLDSKAEKMAFWINAYNAVTIQILLDEGLPAEVPHAAFFGKNIFKQFNEDFYGGDDEGVLKFLKKFGDKDNRIYLEKRDVDIEYLDYQWDLNSQE